MKARDYEGKTKEEIWGKPGVSPKPETKKKKDVKGWNILKRR